jgi:hypothetical protein
MKEKLKQFVLSVHGYIRNINYPLLIAIAIVSRLVSIGASNWGEGISLALVFIASSGIIMWRMHLDRQEDRWKVVVDRELKEIKDFIAHFQLSKNLKDQNERRKQQGQRYF